MILIERAADFYAALLREKKVHDPAVLNFGTFLVQHFHQEGLKIKTEIERQRRDQPTEQRQAQRSTRQVVEKKTLRRFQHPHEGMGQTNFRGGLGKIRGTLQQWIAPELLEDDPDFQQPEVQPTISLPSVVTPVVSTTAVSAKPAVVEAEKKGTLTRAAQEQIAEMQPSTVAKEYDIETMKSWMDDNGVKYKADGSARQIAATLVNHLKRKAE